MAGAARVHIGARRRSAAFAGLRLRWRGPRAWLSHRGGARLAAPDRSLGCGGDERHRLSRRADRLRFHPLLPRPPRRPRLGAGQRAPDRDGSRRYRPAGLGWCAWSSTSRMPRRRDAVRRAGARGARAAVAGTAHPGRRARLREAFETNICDSMAGSVRRWRWKRSPGASSHPVRDPICGYRPRRRRRAMPSPRARARASPTCPSKVG